MADAKQQRQSRRAATNGYSVVVKPALDRPNIGRYDERGTTARVAETKIEDSHAYAGNRQQQTNGRMELNDRYFAL